MKALIAHLFACSIILQACAQPSTDVPTRRIEVGFGPEDMVLQHRPDHARILISCAARRESQPAFGEIMYYVPSEDRVGTLVRTGIADSLYFQPHGIYLDQTASPEKLYVISHEHDAGFHPVYVFDLVGDTLSFVDLIASPLLHSPNALAVGTDGSVYIVNDSGKRGSLAEKMFKLNRANIVRMEKEEQGEWIGSVVAEKLGYPAGINRMNDVLYAGDAINHEVHRFHIDGDGTLEPMEPIEGLRGNDNIRVINGAIYLTGHVKPFKFIGHVNNPDKKSPVTVWKIDPATDKVTTLFEDDGSRISAGSTALVIDNMLYISQVFEPYLLEATLDSL
jgi:hypothetical protein